MRIDFVTPMALVLLFLIPLAWYIVRKSLSNLSSTRRQISLAARLLLLLIVTLAFSGLRVWTTSRHLALIFLGGGSASVAPERRQGILGFMKRQIAGAGNRDYIGVIA